MTLKWYNYEILVCYALVDSKRIFKRR